MNESVEATAQVLAGGEQHVFEFLCECSNNTCLDRITMTIREYEDVRSKGERFALVAGHDDAAIERVVERRDRFDVVEKVGVSRDVARRLDPRD